MTACQVGNGKPKAGKAEMETSKDFATILDGHWSRKQMGRKVQTSQSGVLFKNKGKKH